MLTCELLIKIWASLKLTYKYQLHKSNKVIYFRFEEGAFINPSSFLNKGENQSNVLRDRVKSFAGVAVARMGREVLRRRKGGGFSVDDHRRPGNDFRHAVVLRLRRSGDRRHHAHVRRRRSKPGALHRRSSQPSFALQHPADGWFLIHADVKINLTSHERV